MDLYSNDQEKVMDVLKPDNLDPLVSKFVDEFNNDKIAREDAEKIWIEMHLNYKGVYPKNFVFSGPSKPFVKLTRPRVDHATSRLMEVLSPVGDKVFTFDSTPMPSMPKLQSMLAAQGMPQEDILKAVKNASDQAAINLTIKIDDALVETYWRKKIHDVTYNACLYGLGVMYGPLAVPSGLTPQQVTMSMFNENDNNEVRPECESLSPFEFYAAAGATDIESCDHAWIRKVVSKPMMVGFSRNASMFDIEMVKDIIRDRPNGNWTPEQWEVDVLGANGNDATPNNKYTILIRWGWIYGEDLKALGYEVPENEINNQVMAQIWMCDSKIISIRSSQLHKDRLPFYIATYAKVAHSIYGCGVAECMSDSQKAYNSCERAKYDNLAYTKGRPIMYIEGGRIENVKDMVDIGPGKVILGKASEVPGASKPIDFIPIPCIIKELESTQANLMMLIQEQTGLPNNLMGQGGEGVHNRTSSGASLQYNSAIIPLKGVITNIENDVVIPAITKYKDFFELFSSDESIKGDLKVNALGVSGLVARESGMQKLNLFLQVASQNELWSQQVDMARVGQLQSKYLGLSEERLTYTDAEMKQRMAQQQQQQSEMEQMKAQGMADIETEATKLKAETSPTDILLQVMKVAGPGTAVSYQAMKHVLELKGLLTPEMNESLDTAIDMAEHRELAGIDKTETEIDQMNRPEETAND